MSHTDQVDLRPRPGSRREGSALVLVMLVMMMLTGMVLLLLQSAETSHKQSKELVGLSQATAVADAAMRRAVLRLASGEDDPVVVTDQPFGGKAFAGEYDYEMSIARTSPTRVFRIDAEGRIRTGLPGKPSEWTRAGVQVWIEEQVSGDPPDGAVAGALTVLYDPPSNGDTLPQLEVFKNGNPPEITGNDHYLMGGDINDDDDDDAPTPSNAPAVATNAEAGTSWTGDGSGNANSAAILAAVLTATNPQPEHTNQVQYDTMESWVDALRATSENTTPSTVGAVLPDSSPTSPKIVKYVLDDETKNVSFAEGTQFYGLIIIEVTPDWDGSSPAITFNGNSALHGMVYLELNTLGTNANASKELVLLNGGGNETQLTGALIADVRSKGDYTASKKRIVKINGGGAAPAGLAFSAEGVNMVRNVVGTPTGVTYRTLGYKTTGALGISE